MVFVNKHLLAMKREQRFDLDEEPGGLEADEITALGIPTPMSVPMCSNDGSFRTTSANRSVFSSSPLDCQSYGQVGLSAQPGQGYRSRFIRSGCRKFDAPEPDPIVLALLGGSSEDYEKTMDKVGPNWP